MATTTTATYKVVRYRDGETLGAVEMSKAAYARYEQRAQRPEGIIRAGFVLSSQQLSDMGSYPDETIYLA